MDQTIGTDSVPPPQPVKVVPPGVAFPTMPSAMSKNISRGLVILGIFVASFGASFAKVAEVDPEAAQVVQEKFDPVAVTTALMGVLSAVGGLFKVKADSDQAAAVVAHQAVVAQSEIEKAAAAPPVNGDGRASVEHSASVMLMQAAQAGRLDQVDLIVDLMRKMKGVAA